MSVRKRTRKVGARGSITGTSAVNNRGDKEENPTEMSKEIQREVNTPDPAYVRVDGGITKNLGDYNSCRVSVSVSLPCDPDEESIRKCYDDASGLVDEFLDAEYRKATGEDEE